MRSGRAAAIGIAALDLALADVARAAPPADARTVSEVVVTASKTVSELVVTAPVKCPRVSSGNNLGTSHRPVVVSSFPAKGQTVRPGLVVMRVTFDRPVACTGAFSNDLPLAEPRPGRLQHMVLSYDRRTVCLLDPDKVYGVRLNRDPTPSVIPITANPRLVDPAFADPPGNVFRTVDGAVAQEFSLRFSTTLEAAVTDVCEALREDVEMLAEVEKAHPLDCASRDDPQAAMVKAQVELRDTAARAAREQAIAEARALRERQAAAELAGVEKLAQAAYLKARDRSWAATRRSAVRNKPNPDDERLVIAPAITLKTPDPGIPTVLPANAAAVAAHAPHRGEPTRPPELPDWRQAFVVGAASYDCGFKNGAVTCARR
jgi:hypothetical protein